MIPRGSSFATTKARDWRNARHLRFFAFRAIDVLRARLATLIWLSAATSCLSFWVLVFTNALCNVWAVFLSHFRDIWLYFHLSSLAAASLRRPRLRRASYSRLAILYQWRYRLSSVSEVMFQVLEGESSFAVWIITPIFSTDWSSFITPSTRWRYWEFVDTLWVGTVM